MHWAAHREELWGLTATSSPGQVWMRLALVILVIQSINWIWLPWFLIVTWLLARFAAHSGAMWKSRGNWAHLVYFFFCLIKCFLFFPFSNFVFHNFHWHGQCDLRRGYVSYSYAVFRRNLFFFFGYIFLKYLVLFRGSIIEGLCVPDSMRISNPEHLSFQLMECDWGRNLICEF